VHTILIVEDDDTIRLSLREFLTANGYRVFVSSDGVGAIRHLLDNDIAAIITDFRMEPLGGDYWLRFLHRFCGDKLVYVISGYVSADIEVPFPVVSKPFDYQALEAMVRADLESTGEQ